MQFTLPILVIILTPLVIFWGKPEAQSFFKAHRIISLIAAFFLVSAYAFSFNDCLHNSNSSGCWEYKSLFLTIVNCQYLMMLGWCEIAWRRRNKQLLWPIQENYQFGIISNGIILISILITLTFTYTLSIHGFLMHYINGN